MFQLFVARIVLIRSKNFFIMERGQQKRQNFINDSKYAENRLLF